MTRFEVSSRVISFLVLVIGVTFILNNLESSSKELHAISVYIFEVLHVQLENKSEKGTTRHNRTQQGLNRQANQWFDTERVRTIREHTEHRMRWRQTEDMT